MVDKKSHTVNAVDWDTHIHGYRSSGKSKAAYCEAQGLSVKKFEYHYRRWYEDRKEEQEFPKFQPPEFASVVVTSPAVNLSQQGDANNPDIISFMEVTLPNGICCKVQANFCKTTLKQLMEL